MRLARPVSRVGLGNEASLGSDGSVAAKRWSDGFGAEFIFNLVPFGHDPFSPTVNPMVMEFVSSLDAQRDLRDFDHVTGPTHL